ncbi:MAG: ABC transporter permease, partial [Thermomicrobiales bacterium]
MIAATEQQRTRMLERNVRRQGPFRSVARNIGNNSFALIGASIVLVLVLIALFAPLIAHDDPLMMAIPNQFRAPSTAHWFGTDEFGRDVFSRVVFGARLSLRVGLFATGLAAIAGTLIGLLAGYFGGWLDVGIQMVLNVMLAFPGLLLALAVIAVLGNGLENVLLALSIGGIPLYARMVRGQVLSVREREFVEAGRVCGASTPRLILRHILPNTLSPIIVVASLDLASNILAAASLSFIGLGAQPPSPEWGAMLSGGRDYLRDQWWIATFPGIAIAITVLGFNLLGDG